MKTAAIDQPTPPTKTVGETMRAIVQDRYGSDPDTVLELAEIARPTIGDDEVLVRVVAASVDMGTWHLMTGLPAAMRLAGFGVRRPKAPNPGRSIAGTVESIGKDVTAFAPGDEVYGSCDGAFAEYARVEAGKLARKPVNLSFEEAAAAPISGVTALQAVRRAKVQAVRVRAVLVDRVVVRVVGSTSTTCLSGCRLFQSRMLRSATLSSFPVRRVSIPPG